MDEKKPRESSKNITQNVILENREKVLVSGVLDVETFDESSIEIETDLGNLVIKGENLHINKLNLDTGEIVAQGDIDSIMYTVGNKKGGFFSNMFK